MILIDDDLEERMQDAMDGERPYGIEPHEFVVEVRSVIAHERSGTRPSVGHRRSALHACPDSANPCGFR